MAQMFLNCLPIVLYTGQWSFRCQRWAQGLKPRGFTGRASPLVHLQLFCILDHLYCWASIVGCGQAKPSGKNRLTRDEFTQRFSNGALMTQPLCLDLEQFAQYKSETTPCEIFNSLWFPATQTWQRCSAYLIRVCVCIPAVPAHCFHTDPITSLLWPPTPLSKRFHGRKDHLAMPPAALASEGIQQTYTKKKKTRQNNITLWKQHRGFRN